MDGFNLSNASDLSEALVRSFVFTHPHPPDWIPNIVKALEVFLTKNPSLSDILNFANEVKNHMYVFLQNEEVMRAITSPKKILSPTVNLMPEEEEEVIDLWKANISKKKKGPGNLKNTTMSQTLILLLLSCIHPLKNTL